MALIPTYPPAIEPVSLADLKAHLRLDGAIEDALLGSLITTSRLQVEAALALALITQGWLWTLDRWPDASTIAMPVAPIQNISAITVSTANGTLASVQPADYILDGQAVPARLIAKDKWPLPGARANGIQIGFTAGFGLAAIDVPAPLRQAILLLAAHWYGRRDPSGSCGSFPPLVNDLLAPYRRPRL
jgi:uncharacterized phiE125 gp8 family phage protein